MSKLFNNTSIIVGGIGGVITWITGEWNVALQVLIIAIIIDYATGVIKGLYTGTLSSDIGYKGILKKVMILAIVALANIVQKITGDGIAVREIVIFFFVANEGISILENAAVMLPIPKKLKDLLLQLRGDDDDGNSDKS